MARRPRRPPGRMPQQYLFAEGELDALSCPCGSALVKTDLVNDLGDLVEFAFCPVCGANPATPEQRCIWMPRAARVLGQ